MEKKEVLQKLNNQYFKSLKHFEKIYSVLPGFKAELKKFNSGYLKIISAVLSGDAYKIHVSLYHNFFYNCTATNEKNELRILIDSVPTNH